MNEMTFTGKKQFQAALQFVTLHASKMRGVEIRKQGSIGRARNAIDNAHLDKNVRALPEANLVVKVTVGDDHEFGTLEVWDNRVKGKKGLVYPHAASKRSATTVDAPAKVAKSSHPAGAGAGKTKPAPVQKTTKPPANKQVPAKTKVPAKVTAKTTVPAKVTAKTTVPVKVAAKTTVPAKVATKTTVPVKVAAKTTVPAKTTAASAKKVPAPRADIASYIAGLTYDPQQILAIVPDGTTSSQPVKDRNTVGNAVIICTKIEHSLKKNLSEVAILSPAAGIIFPGALVRADQAMMEGHPTPIALPRAPLTLSVDLPGHSNPSGSVTPTNSSVQAFLNGKLGEWNRDAASKGFKKNAARSILQVSKAFSSQQVALELGFNAKWASGSASAQLGASSTSEKSVLVAYYKQVFYTVAMDTPNPPGSVFGSTVTLAQAKAVFDEAHPPAYVRSVDYGRILMIKMESSNVDTSIDLKAAFQQGEFGGSLDMKYREVFRNSTFTVLAIGGGAETPAKMFSGASDDSLKELEQYIATDTVYREDNPGLPIAYTIAFLKDNTLARLGNSTDYTETECIRYNNGFVRVAHAGAYVAKFQVTWVEPDANGQYTVNKQWESGEKTAGYSQQIDLPGDAKGVRVKAQAATGLVWDPWGEIMNIALDGPDNKTYRATGTTLDRHWDNP
jgi:thiol-activated cytolysin